MHQRRGGWSDKAYLRTHAGKLDVLLTWRTSESEHAIALSRKLLRTHKTNSCSDSCLFLKVSCSTRTPIGADSLSRAISCIISCT
jgi:hypothetical protein